jgi:hypothetical protein
MAKKPTRSMIKEKLKEIVWVAIKQTNKNKLHGLSPLAHYTDRATAGVSGYKMGK